MSRLQTAFEKDSSLAQRVVSAANADPRYRSLFEDISSYVGHLACEVRDLQRRLEENSPSTATEPQSKKRKLSQDGSLGTLKTLNGIQHGAKHVETGKAICTARDISFSVPIRKKLMLEVVTNTGKGDGGLRVVNSGSENVQLALEWLDIEQIIAVPVPEKAQPTYNFIAIPASTTGAPSASSDSADCLVWTVPASGSPKQLTSNNDIVGESDTYVSFLERIINREFKLLGKTLIMPDAQEFVSGIVQAHRKGEKGFHVKAWRGSKDGFLYFLRPGILFGFRKPVLFFPFSSINSVSYTSVLARTFNLFISAFHHGQKPPVEPTDVEFSMIDQADFAGIDAYVKRHGLNDASLTASRRAEQYNISKPKPSPDDRTKEQADEEDGEGELARAERALQDAEDGEEEDFDPGSEGGSDGSGSDSDEGNEENDSGEDMSDDENDMGEA